MMQIVQGPEVAAFVAHQCRAEMFADPYTAIGFKAHGNILGGAVFNGYDGRNVDLSIAHTSKAWPPAFVRFFGDYIWNTLKVERVTMITRPELVPMCKRMGAEMEGVLRKWYPDCDAVICGLLKADWKYDR